ncbi:MAG: hypothetical protein WCC65_08630 [Pseudonocardiaceae bacterium]
MIAPQGFDRIHRGELGVGDLKLDVTQPELARGYMIKLPYDVLEYGPVLPR